MMKSAYEVAREAMTALEFFVVPHSSGSKFQQLKEEVLFTVRNAARNAQQRGDGQSNGDHKFLMMFADALEQSGKPGEYTNHYPKAAEIVG